VITTSETIVVGGGGHGKVVLSVLLSAGFRVDAVLDDNSTLWGQELLGVSIRGPVTSRIDGTTKAVLGIGDNAARRRLSQELPCDWIAATHPAAWVAQDVQVSDGAVVFAGAVVQPGAHIGRHAIVNTRASIDHDCVIGRWSHIAPGATLTGNVVVGDGALVGAGSVILPGVNVGAWAVVGAGAVVTKDVRPHTRVTGVPARVLGGTPPRL